MSSSLAEGCGSPLPYLSRSPSCVENDSGQAAPFSVRLMALMIDFFLLGMVYLVGLGLAGVHAFGLLNGSLDIFLNLSALFSFFLLLGPFFISMSYFTLLHAYGGQTIGKAIMGIKVVTVSGSDLGYVRSWLRWVAYHVSAFPFLAGFLWTVLDAQSRSWHDLLVQSKVINSKI